MDEWIRTIVDIDHNNYIIGQAMSNNPRYQNVHCFDCGHGCEQMKDQNREIEVATW